MRLVSFLVLFSDDSSLLDFNLFDIFTKSVFDGLDDVEFVGFEGVEVSATSDFEFGDLVVLLDEHSYIT